MLIDVIIGFLGSGKTSFILNILEIMASREKMAVIVNEFGDLGIDGAVLSQRDTEIVELSSGCICCTLSRDLLGQVEMLAQKYSPHRLLIEPSGVATVTSLMNILRSLKLEKYVENLRIICIIDAVDFFTFYEQNKLYVESQLKSALLVVINKIDLVEEKVVADIMSLVTQLNKQARVIVTSYGIITVDDFLWIPQNGEHEHEQEEVYEEHIHEHEHMHDEDLAGEILHQHERMEYIPSIQDIESYNLECDDSFHAHEFNLFLNSLLGKEFGEVLRAKGIIHLIERGWVLFNLASGYVTMTPMEKAQPMGKMFIAGRHLQQELLLAQLEKCRYRGA